MEYVIRKAMIDDLNEIVDIYNQAIISKRIAITKTVEPFHKDEWLETHIDNESLFVAESDDSVIGWVSISDYREGRDALLGTKEISYFVDQNYFSMGIGSKLLDFSLYHAEQMEFYSLIAILLANNVASKNLLVKYGFEKWGQLPGVVEIGGEKIDHLYYGKII